jgi:hypothetical protein
MSGDGKEQAKAQLANIRELVAALTLLETRTGGPVTIDGETFDDEDKVRERIEETPLSVLVRSDWFESHILSDDSPHTRGLVYISPAEFEILLCTGGPAVRIVGGLDRGQPDTVHLQWSEWGVPWTDYPLTRQEEEDVLEFAGCFYYGE